eukprot:scaffold1416_cov117-Isochrysis_galbana.AAC.4
MLFQIHYDGPPRTRRLASQCAAVLRRGWRLWRAGGDPVAVRRPTVTVAPGPRSRSPLLQT